MVFVFPKEEIKVKKLRDLPMSLRSRSEVQISFLWLWGLCGNTSATYLIPVTKRVQVDRARDRWEREGGSPNSHQSLSPAYSIKRKSNTHFLFN